MIVSNCPTCGDTSKVDFSTAKDYEYGTSDHIFTYYECSGCKTVYLSETLESNLSEIYPVNYYSTDGGNAAGFINLLISKVKGLLDRLLFQRALKYIDCPKISVLDVGGGTGWVLNQIRNADQRVYKTSVVDLNDQSRTSAERFGHVFYCMPIEKHHPFEKYDFINALNLIEHVSSPRNVLKKFSEILSDDGVVLIKTPNTNSLNRFIFRKKYWGGLHAPRHWVLFNLNNFSDLAKQCGFDILYASYTQGAPQWVASFIGSFSQRPTHEIKIIPMYSKWYASYLMIIFVIIDTIFKPFYKTDQMLFVLKKNCKNRIIKS